MKILSSLSNLFKDFLKISEDIIFGRQSIEIIANERKAPKKCKGWLARKRGKKKSLKSKITISEVKRRKNGKRVKRPDLNWKVHTIGWTEYELWIYSDGWIFTDKSTNLKVFKKKVIASQNIELILSEKCLRLSERQANSIVQSVQTAEWVTTNGAFFWARNTGNSEFPITEWNEHFFGHYAMGHVNNVIAFYQIGKPGRLVTQDLTFVFQLILVSKRLKVK